MTEFNFKPGDKIRDPNWERSVFVRIVALGDETFIGVIITNANEKPEPAAILTIFFKSGICFGFF